MAGNSRGASSRSCRPWPALRPPARGPRPGAAGAGADVNRGGAECHAESSSRPRAVAGAEGRVRPSGVRKTPGGRLLAHIECAEVPASVRFDSRAVRGPRPQQTPRPGPPPAAGGPPGGVLSGTRRRRVSPAARWRAPPRRPNRRHPMPLPRTPRLPRRGSSAARDRRRRARLSRPGRAPHGRRRGPGPRPGWPRQLDFAGGSIVIYQPQPEWLQATRSAPAPPSPTRRPGRPTRSSGSSGSTGSSRWTATATP